MRLSNEYLRKAYELRERVSEAERFRITAFYYGRKPTRANPLLITTSP